MHAELAAAALRERLPCPEEAAAAWAALYCILNGLLSVPNVLRVLQAELAAALLEEEWPDQKEAAAARAAAREAATPVPERVWALRNVGALPSGAPCHALSPIMKREMLIWRMVHSACLSWRTWRCGCLLYPYPHKSCNIVVYPNIAEAWSQLQACKHDRVFLQVQRWRWEAPVSAPGRGECWRRQHCSRLSGLAASATQVHTLPATHNWGLGIHLLYDMQNINEDRMELG